MSNRLAYVVSDTVGHTVNYKYRQKHVSIAKSSNSFLLMMVKGVKTFLSDPVTGKAPMADYDKSYLKS